MTIPIANKDANLFFYRDGDLSRPVSKDASSDILQKRARKGACDSCDKCFLRGSHAGFRPRFGINGIDVFIVLVGQHRRDADVRVPFTQTNADL